MTRLELGKRLRIKKRTARGSAALRDTWWLKNIGMHSKQPDALFFMQINDKTHSIYHLIPLALGEFCCRLNNNDAACAARCVFSHFELQQCRHTNAWQVSHHRRPRRHPFCPLWPGSGSPTEEKARARSCPVGFWSRRRSGSDRCSCHLKNCHSTSLSIVEKCLFAGFCS